MNRKASLVDMAKLKELFGPPPVLSTELPEAYYELLERYFECLGPSDFLMQELVREAVDCVWEKMRYTRHKSYAIERRFRNRRQLEAKRLKQLAEKKAAREKDLATKPEKPANEFERWSELEDAFAASAQNVDELLDRPADDLDHNRALEEGIDYIERLDRLINSATQRYNNVLDQLGRYEELQAALRSLSEAVLREYSDADSKSKQVEAPSIAPNG